MKRRIAGLGAAVAAVMILASADHSGATLASPHAPRWAPDSLASMYDVGGITVIQRRTLGGEIVTANIYLLGGSRQLDAKTAGIETVMLLASEYGTKRYPGETARDAASRSGSAIDVGATADWTTLGFVGLVEDFDSTWTLVADRLVNPTLDSAAVEIGKRRALSSIAARNDDPDEIVRQMAEEGAFVGHPYQNPTAGTVASITLLTPAAVRAYHDAQVVSSRLLVVIAGNLTRAQVEAAVQRTLGTLSKGTYKWTLPDPWKPKSTTVTARRQQLPTNYILGMVGGPVASSPEVLGLQQGLGIIAGDMFAIMRDSGLTYAADAAVLRRGATGGIIQVSTGSPDRALKIINEVIDYYSTGNFSTAAFAGIATGWATSYLVDMATTEAQVSILAESYLYHGDFRFMENYAQQLRQLSPSDMQRSLRAYVKNVQWAYLGDTTRIPRALMAKY